jgi:hypothetical protein
MWVMQRMYKLQQAELSAPSCNMQSDGRAWVSHSRPYSSIMQATLSEPFASCSSPFLFCPSSCSHDSRRAGHGGGSLTAFSASYAPSMSPHGQRGGRLAERAKPNELDRLRKRPYPGFVLSSPPQVPSLTPTKRHVPCHWIENDHHIPLLRGSHMT